MRISRRWRVTLLWLFVLVSVPCVASRKYIRLYLSRNRIVHRPVVDLLRDPGLSGNPQALLAEANRLAFLFNWPRAVPLYSRAEELFRQKGDVRNESYARIGRILARAGTIPVEDGPELLRQELGLAIMKSDPKLRLWCLVSKGYVDLNFNPSSAKRDWADAQKLAHELGEAQWEARATGELGIVTFLEGDAGRAATMAGDALLSALATGDVGGQIQYLEIIGSGLNELTRHEEALVLFNRAIKLAASTPDAPFPFMVFESKSDAFAGQGRLKEAKEVLDQALLAARRDETRAHESVILIELGDLALRTGDRESGKHYLQQASVVAARHKLLRSLGAAMTSLAEVYRVAGDLKAAEECASICVDARRRFGDRFFLPRDLTMLAKLKAARGKVGEANALYESAEDVIDGMLITLHEPYWTSSLASATSETYLSHFELEAGSGSPERALHVLERIRGRTLAALLQNKVSFSSDESEQTRTLEDTVSELQLRLMRSEDAQERANLLDKLAESERRLEWAHKDEGASTWRWFDQPASLGSVQASLRVDEVVLEYVLSEPHAYCVWISKSAAGVEPLPAGRQAIEALTRSYLGEIRAKKDDVAVAKVLYNTLLRPLLQRSNVQRVIIVPDGILHFLPFEILRDPEGSLVLDSRTISYAPASTVLKALRTTADTKVSRRSFLGIGDAPYQGQKGLSATVAGSHGTRARLLRGFSDVFGTRLYDLPQTREEVLTISRNFGKDTTVLLGSEATETAFKSQPLADFKIVHLAVHGFANTQFPERSGLVLGVDPASRDDGLLQVREIIRLRFNADLVTLSACDTGVGKLQGEEGVTNLVEAFLGSGAKAVVASLWSADDTYTLVLMQRFYIHIAEAQDKATALRLAKLDLLAKYGRQLPPYYWAAFILTGDGGSPIRWKLR
jgi:CHAT domain-containing protein